MPRLLGGPAGVGVREQQARPDGLSFYCLACNRRRNRRWYRDSRAARAREGRDTSWVPEGHRWCPMCRHAVPVEEVSVNARTASGFGSECRPCRRETSKEAYFRQKYGISRATVAELRTQQGDACAVCGDLGAAHLDHDHSTGRIRALLCGRCNMGLGLFLDDPVRLRLAADYVERHRGEPAAAVDPPTGCTTTPALGSDRRERRGSRPGRRSTDRHDQGEQSDRRRTAGEADA